MPLTLRTTGSMTNLVDSRCKSSTPEIGMGATILMWTDRKAGTIVEISKNGKEVTFQEDKATRTDSNGMSDCQSYSYAPDPSAAKQRFSLRKDGSWYAVGTKRGSPLMIGRRDAYYDYSF